MHNFFVKHHAPIPHMFGLLEESEVPQENTQTQENKQILYRFKPMMVNFFKFFLQCVIKTNCLVEKHI